MINVEAAFREIQKHRQGAVSIPCQTARHSWYKVTESPELDIYFRGVMGKGSSVGLGVALARPERKVLVFDGDGSLLMNLGTLATIAQQAPKNMILFVLENGVYAGTGGQPTPAKGMVDFCGIAKASGFPAAFEFDALETFSEQLPSVLNTEGPVFVTLKTELVPGGNHKYDDLPTIKDGIATLRKTFAQMDRSKP